MRVFTTSHLISLYFFFFNDTATTEIYTLSLHDALPIYAHHHRLAQGLARQHHRGRGDGDDRQRDDLQDRHRRSEEHTSELQSPCNLVCRLLLEKKKKKPNCSPYGHDCTTVAITISRLAI